MLDEIVQSRRNTKAARRLLTRLLKKQGIAPKRMRFEGGRRNGEGSVAAGNSALLPQELPEARLDRPEFELSF